MCINPVLQFILKQEEEEVGKWAKHVHKGDGRRDRIEEGMIEAQQGWEKKEEKKGKEKN